MRTHLTDLEELISTIQQPRIADYMREAMSCYMAKAYRGCIVLSCIALFDDLVDKLTELAKIDSGARDILNEVTKRQKEQDVYENYLLDQLKSKGIMPHLTSDILSSIKEKRNRSAHPSGHQPTAEEARYVFSEVIIRVLSEPKLTTTQGVDQILIRLPSLNFFPIRRIDEIALIVKDEIQELHLRSFPYLIVKLVELLAIENPIDTRNNSLRFFVGLAQLNRIELNQYIFNKLIKIKSDDLAYSVVILSCISANPRLFDLFDVATVKRFRNLVIHQIQNLSNDIVTAPHHPSCVLTALMTTLDPKYFITNFHSEVKSYLEKYPYDTSIYKIFSFDEILLATHKADLIEKAGSTTFDTANAFAINYQSIEADLVDYWSGEDLFVLLLNILNAAQNRANRAKDLRSSRFDRIPFTKSKVKRYILENKSQAQEIIRKHLWNPVTVDELFSMYFEDILDDEDNK
jgi:hypothetical protein